jgi:taurine dioxygenase
MSLTVTPFQAPLGASITGLAAGDPLSEADGKTLKTALRDYLVLLIRGVPLSDSELVAFSRAFGELDPPGPNPYGTVFLPDYPELNVISNVMEDGRPIGNLGAGEAVWHADMTYIDNPPKAGVLHALEVPAEGGNTYFANMYAAWDALDEERKTEIEDKAAIHDAAHNSAGMLRKGYEEVADVTKTPGAHHPLVRKDPETGRKALFLGRRPNSYIVGLSVARSEQLLDALWAHATRKEFAIEHVWQPADTLVWNNLAVLHRRDPFDPDTRRIMHRAQIRGESNAAVAHA